VERDRGRLVLSFPGLEDLEVDLRIEEVRQQQQGTMCVGEVSLFLHIRQNTEFIKFGSGSGFIEKLVSGS
jgi:hypothetical protein